MGAAGRALIGLGLIALTACGSPHPAASTSTTYVPWLALAPTNVYPEPPPPTPAPPFQIPPGTAACIAQQLTPRLGGTAAATGSNVDMPVVLVNAGLTDCVLEGFADVTVLGAHGSVLARAAGATGRGTYFNDGPVVPILVRAAGGQAFMNLTWYDCRNPRASQLALDLPGGGGRIVMSFPVTGRYYMLCDTDPHFAELSRGPFSPMGIDWPPGPTYMPVRISIQAPAQAKAGSTLVYFVTVANTSSLDYRLSPCPDYNEFLGAKAVVASYNLNCRPVGHIAPGAAFTFEMHMALPSSLSAGPSQLTWGLNDGRLAMPVATAGIEVTA